jgi:hypothetical protein
MPALEHSRILCSMTTATHAPKAIGAHCKLRVRVSVIEQLEQQNQVFRTSHIDIIEPNWDDDIPLAPKQSCYHI